MTNAEIAQRDSKTLANLNAAAESIEAALREMPNHVESAFGEGDARMLSAVQRDLNVLLTAQVEVESKKRDPS